MHGGGPPVTAGKPLDKAYRTSDAAMVKVTLLVAPLSTLQYSANFLAHLCPIPQPSISCALLKRSQKAGL